MKTKELFAAEVNLTNMPESLLEQSNFRSDQLPQVLQSLYMHYDEVLILFTSQRLAIYAVGNSHIPLVGAFSVCPRLSPLVYYINGVDNIIYHFFATTSGLYCKQKDRASHLEMINNCYHIAQEANCIGLVFYNLIQDAIYLQSEMDALRNVNANTRFLSSMRKKEKELMMVLTETLKFSGFLKKLSDQTRNHPIVTNPLGSHQWLYNQHSSMKSYEVHQPISHTSKSGFPYHLCEN